MIELPKEKQKATRKSPKTLVLYAAPKVGKTTALAQLDNNLILDLEDGATFVDALRIKINSLEHLKEVGREIIKSGKPYKYTSLDTVSLLEEWCELEATRKYKESIMGSKFRGNTILLLRLCSIKMLF